MSIIETISSWFSKPKKLTCSCGSTDIKTKMSYRRTVPPKNPIKGRVPGIGYRVSYGYKFNVHTCNKCGYLWEGEKI